MVQGLLLSHTYLNDAVHVGDETVDADLQQHYQGSAHIFSNLRVLICCQRKQALRGRRKNRNK